jgi:hypothetical protein
MDCVRRLHTEVGEPLKNAVTIHGILPIDTMVVVVFGCVLGGETVLKLSIRIWVNGLLV